MNNEFLKHGIYYGPELQRHSTEDGLDRIVICNGWVVLSFTNHRFIDGPMLWVVPYWRGTLNIMPPEIAA